MTGGVLTGDKYTQPSPGEIICYEQSHRSCSTDNDIVRLLSLGHIGFFDSSEECGYEIDVAGNVRESEEVSHDGGLRATLYSVTG